VQYSWFAVAIQFEVKGRRGLIPSEG
jgi:hypothetical protein